MKLKEVVIAVIAVAVIAVLGYVWFMPTGVKQAPDVTLHTIDGRKIPLAELRGHPVLINFWATTCPGCVKEMPHLVNLYNEFKSRGFVLIGIAVAYDPPDQVLRMVKDKRIPYPIALDLSNQAATAFGNIQLIPTSFLIAPDGRIVQQKIGEINPEKMRDKIRAMLKSS